MLLIFDVHLVGMKDVLGNVRAARFENILNKWPCEELSPNSIASGGGDANRAWWCNRFHPISFICSKTMWLVSAQPTINGAFQSSLSVTHICKAWGGVDKCICMYLRYMFHCSRLSVVKLVVRVEQTSHTSLNSGFDRVYVSFYSFRRLVGVYLVRWYFSLTSSSLCCAHVYNNINTPSCQRFHIIPVTHNVICFDNNYPLSYFFFFVTWNDKWHVGVWYFHDFVHVFQSVESNKTTVSSLGTSKESGSLWLQVISTLMIQNTFFYSMIIVNTQEKNTNNI